MAQGVALARDAGGRGPAAAPLLGISQREPPGNLRAEQALLGALLARTDAYEKVAEFLRPAHFLDPIHARIYGAIQACCDAGRLADAVTLRAQFEGDGTLQEVGGADYLAELVSGMASILSVESYGRAILDLWRRREMIGVAEGIVAACYGDAQEAPAILEAVDGQLMRLVEGERARTLRDTAQVAAQLEAEVMATIAREGGLAGVTWGLKAMNRMTGGLVGGQLVVVGARPSMGKTALALTTAIAAAEDARRVLFISAEMKASSVLARAAAGRARLPLTVATRGGMEAEDGTWRRLTQGAQELNLLGYAMRELSALPLYWDDEVKTVPGIRARARAMKRSGGLDLIVVDYLQLLRASPEAEKWGPVQKVAEISNGLKALAKELDVPVLLLSQLSRESEKREDKTPGMADLRYSGEIEQDADVIVLIHREHYYLSRSEPVRTDREKVEQYDERVRVWEKRVQDTAGRATLLVVKQRQGATGPVRVGFRDDRAQFHDEGAEA